MSSEQLMNSEQLMSFEQLISSEQLILRNFENFVKGTAVNGVYPNTIQLGSVDFFLGGPFTNNINYATGFTLNMEPIGGSKLSSQSSRSFRSESR